MNLRQRVLVVDDSPFFCRILSDWIKGEPDMELVGTASNGQEAIQQAKTLAPDVIVLDLEMPVKDGLTALQEIVREVKCSVLMSSSTTQPAVRQMSFALEFGAYDYIFKPTGKSVTESSSCKGAFLAKVRAARPASTLIDSPQQRAGT